MDGFLAKKTGEILAFSRLTKETLKRAKKGLSEVIEESELEKMAKDSDLLSQKIQKVAENNDVKEAVVLKSQKTEDKILKMQDLYLADEKDWEDPAELFEWLGFFEGAVAVHFSLVVGKARDEGVNDLTEVASEGLKFHKDFLEQVSLLIRKV